ncbi:MAG: tellurite resistance/C4-dicarboxylate transporter family protein [Alicyclobacillus sp.]|nr:tellurite resistance/C4-dicarboxylate transporter family protein [Alicyclobacillus sp.]
MRGHEPPFDGPDARLKALYPGYFALVMATGILSVVAKFAEWNLLSVGLLVVAVGLYLWLFVVYLVRLFCFPRDVRADVLDPRRVFGYFTFVAGTDILATRLSQSGFVWPVVGLGLVAGVTWLALLYTIFATLLFYNRLPVEQAVNGSWLIATVATQSLSVVATIVGGMFRTQAVFLLFASYVFWSFGILLYLIFIVLIVYRFFFHPVRREDLSPPYWINMGAMAITAVAGGRLAVPATPTHFLSAVHPFVVAFTVTMWAWGTWWIPLLVIMGIWKNRRMRDLRYDPTLWSIVFPIGMYGASLHVMSTLPGLHFLDQGMRAFLVAGLTCWCLVGVDWVLTPSFHDG